MKKEVPDNYRENPIKYYMQELSSLDAPGIAARCGLKYSGELVYINILGTDYEIQIPSFKYRNLTPQSPDYLKDKGAQVLILHFLTESGFAPSSGRFISYREYPSGDLYFKAFDGRCLKRLAFSYGTRAAEFERDYIRLGAKKIEGGDAACEIDFIPGLTLRLIIWGPDEDFPPAAQILFSDNFPISFSAEGVAGLGDILISALKGKFRA